MATFAMNKAFISSKRILVRYEDDGGYDKDGIIELRPGVSDISIGDRKYAQVVIAIDSRWYIRGMAVYSNDIPEGYDIVYYTRKLRGTPLKQRKSFGNSMWLSGTVFKYVSSSMPFTFGDHPMLILLNEGNWSKWSESLSRIPESTLTAIPISIPPAWKSNVTDAISSINIAREKMRKANQEDTLDYKLLSNSIEMLRTVCNHY